MNVGQFVFPTALVGAFIVLASFVASNPARPADVDPAQRLLRVEPGDEVHLELTGYYGASGFVFLSTQEERRLSGEFQAREGPYAAQSQAAAIEHVVNPDATADAITLDADLLGHKVNESFTTQEFPASASFGDWGETKEFPRSPLPFPLTVTFDGRTSVGGGRTFNLTLYRQYWSVNGYSDLTPGVEFPCEGPAVWTCRVVAVDVANGSFSYRRNVENGDRVPLEVLFEGSNVRAAGEATVTVDEAADEFAVAWSPVVGDKFQVRQAVPGFLPAGSYWVGAIRADRFEARFTENAVSPIYLIGEPTWYDVVITRIVRAPPTTPAVPPNQ